MPLRQPISAEAVTERGLSALVWEGIFAQALGVFASGTLLTGCALELGASPGFIGLLSAIPFFAQLAQIPAVILIEKLRRRRRICLAATLMARAMLLPLVLVPFLADHHLGLALLMAANAVLAPLAAVAGCAWMSWTCDLVPHDRLGDVFGRRQLRATIAGVAAGLLGGAIVSLWTQEMPGWRAGGYAGVFGLAILVGAASSWCLARMPEVAMPPPDLGGLRKLFARPFRDANFRRLMGFLGCWQFAVNLVLPFFPVYLLQSLHYRIITVIALGIVAQLASVAALPFWSRLSDRWSNKTVIALCGPLFLCCPFGWVLATEPALHFLTLPLFAALQLILGTATAGLDLAGGNIALKLAPRGEATVFLGANSLVKSLCAGCAPIAGAFLLNGMMTFDGSVLPGWSSDVLAMMRVEPWHIFFIATGCLGAVALTQLARITERGEVPVRMLLSWIRPYFEETIELPPLRREVSLAYAEGLERGLVTLEDTARPTHKSFPDGRRLGDESIEAEAV